MQGQNFGLLQFDRRSLGTSVVVSRPPSFYRHVRLKLDARVVVMEHTGFTRCCADIAINIRADGLDSICKSVGECGGCELIAMQGGKRINGQN
jgi:hypothetical protein